MEESIASRVSVIRVQNVNVKEEEQQTIQIN
jgi:hypothetical protein